MKNLLLMFSLLMLTGNLFANNQSYTDGAEPSDFIKVNVFGHDDREYANYDDRPYSWIVRVGNNCTGALVGKALVLTAAHCIRKYYKKEKGKWIRKKNYKVYTRYSKGQHGGSSSVRSATWGGFSDQPSKADPTEDWAILRLSRPLGKKYGWFGFYHRINLLFNDLLDDINLAGFSNDFGGGQVLSVHKNCRVRDSNFHEFFYDCDMTRGASGAPVWVVKDGHYYIVAISFADLRLGAEKSLKGIPYSSDRASLGIRPHVWSSHLKKERDKEDSI